MCRSSYLRTAFSLDDSVRSVCVYFLGSAKFQEARKSKVKSTGRFLPGHQCQDIADLRLQLSLSLEGDTRLFAPIFELMESVTE